MKRESSLPSNTPIRRLLVLAAFLFVFGVLSAMPASADLIVDTTWTTGPPPPNDCSGVFGQGFENCVFNGSPVIAKFNTDGTGWQLNNTDFPSVDGTEWTFTPNNPPTNGNTNGTWSYTPGAGDPGIRYWVAKGGNQGFLLFFDVTNPTQGCINDPSTCYDQANIVNTGSFSTPGGQGLSHITFYDTGPTPPGSAPAPAPLALIGLSGLILWTARRRQHI